MSGNGYLYRVGGFSYPQGFGVLVVDSSLLGARDGIASFTLLGIHSGQPIPDNEPEAVRLPCHQPSS